jgi:U1 small nuclear ribonucleoprotein
VKGTGGDGGSAGKMNIPIPQINALFAPRPPIEFIPPIDTQLPKKRKHEFTGFAQYTKDFEIGPEYDEIMSKWKPIEQRPERRERIKEERKAMCEETLAEKIAAWDPSTYSFESDAYKTLFIARLSFMTDEHKIKREMEQVREPVVACKSARIFCSCHR